jgi:hypothetical protein
MRAHPSPRGGRQAAILITLSLLIAGLGTAYAFWPHPVTITQHGYASQPDDLRIVAEDSVYVVEGVVEEVLPATWTTADGAPPADLLQANRDPDIQLRTPVRLAVERVLKGQEVPRHLLFTYPGGSAGNVTVEAFDNLPLAAGDRIVTFLSQAPPNAGRWAEISPLYPQLTFIVAGETLVGPLTDVERADFPADFE